MATVSNMDNFEIYKNDWKYPICVRNPNIKQGMIVGKCVTFQEAMKVTLVTGQCFGLNPVLGVLEADASKLRFKYRSWRFFYTVLSIYVQCSCLLFCVLRILKDNDVSLGSSTNVIFYLSNSCTTIIFVRIAMKWPRLCVHIAKTETADPNMDQKLVKVCNMSCLIILSLALFEHTLSDMSGISVIIECDPDKNLLEAFVEQSFPWVWAFIPYNHFIGILTLLTNIQCTFNWNFADLFVICMSYYLSSRLDQVNLRISAVKNKFVPSSYWRTMREDYNRITSLVRAVDDIIGGVVFISFANNLFFICLQLLHTLAPFHGYEHAVYFVFSFSFLVLRSLAVSVAASRVHTASKAPAQALYDVSSSTYCVEIQRFLEQIHGDTVSLSGLQFFHVKRGIILSESNASSNIYQSEHPTVRVPFHQRYATLHCCRCIAGTIVTYELVLMQFTGISPTSAPI